MASLLILASCATKQEKDDFDYTVESFADLEILTFAVSGIVLIDCFESAANGQVPFSVLVIKYIPAVCRSFGEVINQFFLF